MLYAVSKVLQEFVMPLNVTLLLMAAAVAANWRGRGRLSRRLTAAALVLLYVASTPVFVAPLLFSLESTPTPVSESPSAPAIVLLGGTVYRQRPPRPIPEELSGARLTHALRLFKAGKAPKIIVAGGLPYRDGEGNRRAEADDLADLLLILGVPASAIVKENGSRTTYENAINVRELLERSGDPTRVLLVTSALHMRRAAALFRKQGVEVIEAPNSYLATTFDWEIRSFVPQPAVLSSSTAAVKELVGFVAYRLMGKL